jgi:hypothetical protein
LSALVGVAFGEGQLLSWPRPSVKSIQSVQIGASSLTVKF